VPTPGATQARNVNADDTAPFRFFSGSYVGVIIRQRSATTLSRWPSSPCCTDSAMQRASSSCVKGFASRVGAFGKVARDHDRQHWPHARQPE